VDPGAVGSTAHTSDTGVGAGQAADTRRRLTGRGQDLLNQTGSLVRLASGLPRCARRLRTRRRIGLTRKSGLAWKPWLRLRLSGILREWIVGLPSGLIAGERIIRLGRIYRLTGRRRVPGLSGQHRLRRIARLSRVNRLSVLVRILRQSGIYRLTWILGWLPRKGRQAGSIRLSGELLTILRLLPRKRLSRI
jgi:hypothetical protein